MAVYFSFILLLRAVDYENAIANVFGQLITGRNKRRLRGRGLIKSDGGKPADDFVWKEWK